MKYVETFKDRFGKKRFYFRRSKKHKRFSLPTPVGSEAFEIKYNGLLNDHSGAKIPSVSICIPKTKIDFGREGKIYVIEFSDWIKIGFSENPETRLKAIQTSLPSRVHIIRLIEGRQYIERRLHHRFRKQRAFGEWFRKEGAVLAWLAATDNSKFGAIKNNIDPSRAVLSKFGELSH